MYELFYLETGRIEFFFLLAHVYKTGGTFQMYMLSRKYIHLDSLNYQLLLLHLRFLRQSMCGRKDIHFCFPCYNEPVKKKREEEKRRFIMSKNLLTLTIGKQKSIALIAHDGKKEDLISWCDEHKEILSRHFLCGTGTTARMITDRTGLPVKGYNSGPLGGDQQIGAKIVEGRIDFVVFFSDPLTAAPHDPDVKALLRVAQVYDIPIANNRATADFMITSPLMNQEYDHDVIDFQRNIAERANSL